VRRGAVGNPEGRFEVRRVEPFDDGWAPADPAPAPLRTTVTPEAARSIVTRNDSPDVPFTQSINPYRGCEHGCIYCFARPSHSYLGLSPGLDFESRIFSKPDAPELLRGELRRPRYRCSVIVLGANTDPYQPVERGLGLTRSLLGVLREHRHPVTVVTKSNLVLRDLDLLAPMAREGLALVLVSVTTLDRGLARRMEPRAPTPERRLEALGALRRAGVPTGLLASPIIPALNDHEIERIVEAAAGVGAGFVRYLLVRLPWELKGLFSDWLETHYPARRNKVLNMLRASRGGRLNDPRFGRRMRGEGPFAEMLARRFETALRRHGLASEPPELRTDLFRLPSRPGDQRPLFG